MVVGGAMIEGLPGQLVVRVGVEVAGGGVIGVHCLRELWKWLSNEGSQVTRECGGRPERLERSL